MNISHQIIVFMNSSGFEHLLPLVPAAHMATEVMFRSEQLKLSGI